MANREFIRVLSGKTSVVLIAVSKKISLFPVRHLQPQRVSLNLRSKVCQTLSKKLANVLKLTSTSQEEHFEENFGRKQESLTFESSIESVNFKTFRKLWAKFFQQVCQNYILCDLSGQIIWKKMILQVPRSWRYRILWLTGEKNLNTERKNFSS